jgi:Metallo-beta-lactamase superfamily
VNLAWEHVADGVSRCRLKFLDVTVGLVYGDTGVLLVDTGTTLAEAGAIAADVQSMCGRDVSHIVLTHNHSDPAAWPATLDRVLAMAGEDAVFVPATVPSSTRPLSAASGPGWSTGCDEIPPESVM